MLPKLLHWLPIRTRGTRTDTIQPFVLVESISSHSIAMQLIFFFFKLIFIDWAQDLISKLPGVNSKNIRRIMNKVDDLGHLISLSQVSRFVIIPFSCISLCVIFFFFYYYFLIFFLIFFFLGRIERIIGEFGQRPWTVAVSAFIAAFGCQTGRWADSKERQEVEGQITKEMNFITIIVIY